MGTTPLLDEFLVVTRNEFPDFKLVNKSNSALMRFLGKLLYVISFGGMQSFMTSYTTTIGRTIYLPDHWATWGDTARVTVLRHERVHLRQARKYTRPVFFFLYLLPILPVGLAYFRAKFEKEAYEESIRATCEYRGFAAVNTPEYRDSILNQFTSGAYLFMWPFRRPLEVWFAAVIHDLAN